MELRQIYTFITLSEMNSFTQTAEKLGYTQPTITSQIQLLEQELGVQLFERLRKNIYLTSEGEAFLDYAKQIVQLCESSKTEMKAFGSSKRTLRIGTLESLASSRLSGLFRDFREAFPDVEIVIKIDDSKNFCTLLQENKIDVAIYLESEISHPDLVVDAFALEPIALLASPNHPILIQDRIFVKELSEYPLILSEEGCSYRNLIINQMSQCNLSPLSIMEVGSIHVIKQLVMTGLGITILPKIAVEFDLIHNSLAEIKWEGDPLCLRTQIVYHKDKWISPTLSDFLNMARAHLEDAI